MSKDFEPYEEEKKIKCEITKDEAILIEKIRDVKFGKVIVHKVGGNIVRTETVASELMKDMRDGKVGTRIKSIIEDNE